MTALLRNLQQEKTLIALGMLFSLVISCIFTSVSANFQRDDALIYYRYISNVLDGNGLVYNVGEKFNALTSPLHTYISIPFAYVTGDIQTSQVILGALFLWLTATTVMMIFRKQGMTPYGIAASLLIVSTPYYYLAFGMETMLLLLLISAAIYLYLDGRYMLLGVVSGLLVLTRGEGILLVLTLCIFFLIKRRKLFPASFFLAFAAVLTPHLLFNYFYFGQMFPHTLTAKIAQGESGLWGGHFAFLKPSRLPPLFQTSFLAKGYLMLSIPVALTLISLPLWIKSEFARIYIVFLLIYTAFYVTLNVPAYYWYYAVYFLFLNIFSAYGIKAIHDFSAKQLQTGMVTATLGLVVFVVLLSLQLMSVDKINNAGPHPHYKDIGIWIDENTPPDSKVACSEIGHIGWYSKRYIIDIVGLVSPNNAEFISKNDYNGWLRYYDPDYILAHEPLWPYEQAAQDLLESGAYVPVPGFDFDGYVLIMKSSRGPE